MRQFNPASFLVLNAGAQSLIRLVSNVVLANLLFPEAFALTAVATVVMIGVQMLTDVGIATATLKDGVPREGEASKLWTIQLVRGLLLAAMLAACAVPLGAAYGSAELGQVLLVLSLVPAIQGAQSLYPTVRLADQDLLPLVGTEIAGRLFGAVASILFALAYPSVWALVAGMIAGALVGTLSTHLLGRKSLPSFDLDWSYFKQKWGFFRWIQLGSAVTFLAMQVDKALFPFLYGLQALGVYAIAATFAQMPAQLTQKWSANVYFPLVARLLGKGRAATEELNRIRSGMLWYTALVTIGMFVVAPAFFLLLYKSDYHSAGALAQVLVAQVYFELAESSLRHFPLIAKSSRYEFLATKVRLIAFGIGALIVYASGAGPLLYALAFTMAQAASYGFMLYVCHRDGYISRLSEISIALLVLGGVALSFFNLDWPASAASALPVLVGAGALSLAMLALVYRRYGLPSLNQTSLDRYASPDILQPGHPA